MSDIDPTLQRYVIAQTEAWRANRQAADALAAMRREESAARRALGEPYRRRSVELLNSGLYEVFYDSAGIVVIPKS